MDFGLAPKKITTGSPVDAGTEGPSIYVGAASSEIGRAKAVIARLKGLGFRVTSTWPDTITKVGDANPMGAPVEDRAKWSMQDLNEVMDAQILLVLLPNDGVSTIGAWIEMGFALALGLLSEQMRQTGAPVPERYVISAGKERSIFTALSQHFATDEEAINALVEAR